MKRPDHRGGWHVHQKSSKSIFLGNGPAPPGTAAYSRCSACPRTRVPFRCTGRLCCAFFRSRESVRGDPAQISRSKRCARACVCAFSRHFACARICAPFRPRFRNRICGDPLKRAFRAEIMPGSAPTRVCLRVFPLLRPRARLRPLPPPLPASHMRRPP